MMHNNPCLRHLEKKLIFFLLIVFVIKLIINKIMKTCTALALIFPEETYQKISNNHIVHQKISNNHIVHQTDTSIYNTLIATKCISREIATRCHRSIPITLLNIYLSGYPYIIHNICTKRKNIIDKIMIDDALSVILNFCIDSEHYKKNHCDGKYCHCRIDLVCKKWSKIIGPGIKKIQLNARIYSEFYPFRIVQYFWTPK